MTRQHKKSAEAVLQESPCSLPAANLQTELHIDDDWLEALLDNLALAGLSRVDCVSLIERLEDLERSRTGSSWREPSLVIDAGPAGFDPHRSTTELVVGEHFSDEFNEYQMRSPESMTGENVQDAIVRAVRYLGSQRHAAAVRQIVFFIASNLEEVIAEWDDDE